MTSGTDNSTLQSSSAILVVARGNSFSTTLMERALEMARDSHNILVALNVCSDDEFSPGVRGQRARRNYRADCHWNILATRKAAVLLNVRLDHLILFGSAVECIENVQSKYPHLRCVLAEPPERDTEIQTPTGAALSRHKAIAG